MSKVMEYTRYLSEELGPRPTGTEEEQQAALYIAEKLQQDAGLPAVIEDFNSEGEEPTAMNICATVAFLCVILAMFVDVLALPTIILSLVVAFFAFSEVYGKPILSKMFRKNISQNVVATYNPNYGQTQQSNRARKVVLVAHYDSGRTRGTLDGPLGSLIPLLDKIALWSIIATPVFLLIRNLFFAHSLGVVGIIVTVLSVLLLVCLAINLVRIVLFKMAKYNNAANNNATGVAVLMDLAAQINNGGEALPSSESYNTDAIIHGRAAAYAAGVVDAGVDLTYENGLEYDESGNAIAAAAAVAGMAAGGVLSAAEAAAVAEAIDPNSPEAGLLAAKAAIAAMTGKPVSMVNHLNQPPINAAAEPMYGAAGYEEPSYASTVEVAPAATEAEIEEGSAVGDEADFEPEAALDGVEQAAAETADGVAAEEGSADASSDGAAAASIAAAPAVAPAIPAAVEKPEEDDSNLPDWFKRAKKNAKRQEDIPVQRSVFNDALESANNPEEPVAQEVQEEAAVAASVAGAAGAEAAAPKAADTGAQAEANEAKAAVESVAAAEAGNAASAEADAEDMLVVGQHVSGDEQAQAEGQEEPVHGRHAQKETEEETASPAIERPTTLPNMNTSSLTPIDQDALKQRAPLADAAGAGGRSVAAKGLLSLIPEINLDDELPSLSPIDFEQGEETVLLPPVPQSMPGMKGAFSSVNESLFDGSDADDDLYVDDADDDYNGGFNNFSAHGSMAFADMPKKKKGLFGKLFGRKKQEEEMSTSEWLGVDESFDAREVGKARGGWESFREDNYNDGYGYNDGYDAYDNGYGNNGYNDGYGNNEGYDAYDNGYGNNGSNNGGYNNGYDAYSGNYDNSYGDGYSEDGYDTYNNNYDDNYNDGETYNPYRAYNGENWEEDDRWNGGAFGPIKFGKGKGNKADKADKKSRKDKKRRGRKQEELEEERYGNEFDEYGDGFADDGYGADYDEFANFEEGDYAPRLDVSMDGEQYGDEEKMYDDFYMQPNTHSEALKEIFEFRNTGLDTEVWFVALGSENANHSGMKSFMKEHERDLHGAIVIEIDALGAGDLSYIGNEGRYKTVATSSRMKRYVDKAASALGMSVNTADIPYLDSAASVANKAGTQALHLVGMNGAKPALLGQYNDTFDAIDEDLLVQNEEFILELMKSI